MTARIPHNTVNITSRKYRSVNGEKFSAYTYIAADSSSKYVQQKFHEICQIAKLSVDASIYNIYDACLVVSGGVWSMSGGVWSMSGGVNVYRLI